MHFRVVRIWWSQPGGFGALACSESSSALIPDGGHIRLHGAGGYLEILR
jgi:hypothetical protein